MISMHAWSRAGPVSLDARRDAVRVAAKMKTTAPSAGQSAAVVCLVVYAVEKIIRRGEQKRKFCSILSVKLT